MNSNPNMVEIYSAQGMLEAEMIKLYLQSYEIEATISQESAGIVYGFTIGSLGAAHIYVREEDAPRATQLMDSMLSNAGDETDTVDQ